jgi:tRNA (uracil-5-)-methyltransferase TRM9
MEMSTVAQLAELNRRFYEEHAENFADARPRLQPGVRLILDRIAPGARVLEAGCGDGKVARALPGVHYTGFDQSLALLERARRYMPAAGSAGAVRPAAWSFRPADLLSPDFPAQVPGAGFDWVLAFAVFHHLPSYAARERALRHLAERLAPGGTLVLSNWQFHTSPRLLRRQAPWSTVGLKPADVEPGDFLLTWERKGQHGLRYVHALDAAEARALAEAAGLTVVEVFQSDGVNGALAEYVVSR